MGDQLSIRIRLGDEQAFELLFRKFFVCLCGFANKYLNDPDQAKETVQEAFCKIWEAREELDPENSIKAYLFKITKNLCINILRKRKVEAKYSEIYKQIYCDFRVSYSIHEHLCADELEKGIASAISKLPRECRKIFELSRNDGLKYKEIADTLNISVKTVEGQMSKAFRILRLELNEYLGLILFVLTIGNQLVY